MCDADEDILDCHPELGRTCGWHQLCEDLDHRDRCLDQANVDRGCAWYWHDDGSRHVTQLPGYGRNTLRSGCIFLPESCTNLIGSSIADDGECDEGGLTGCDIGTDSIDCRNSGCSAQGICMPGKGDCSLCGGHAGFRNPVYSALSLAGRHVPAVLLAGSATVLLVVVAVAVRRRRRAERGAASSQEHTPLATSDEADSAAAAAPEGAEEERRDGERAALTGLV